MNKQKKPLYWYYIVILVVLLLVNMIIGPMFSNSHIREVTYSDFLDAIEEKEIQDVEVHDTEIYYTLKGDEETVYQTGAMQDAQPKEPDTAAEAQSVYQTGAMQDAQLVDRLDEAGATFTKVQTEEMNPLLSYLITLFLPLLIFWGLGSFLFRRMQKKMGKDAMSFGGGGFGMGGLGKSNAKVYVPAQGGKTFKDVAGQDEAKEALKEIVDFLNHPDKYKDIGAQMPKGALLVGPPSPARHCLPRPLPARPECRSSLSAAVSLSRCSSAAALQRCVTCSSRRGKRRRASSSSMRSIRSARSVTARALPATMSASRH